MQRAALAAVFPMPLDGRARWVALCATAEVIGMATAAGAASVADGLPPAPGGGAPPLAWAAVVLGGLVEGTAVGVAQAAALRPAVPRLDLRRWLGATVLVAGLGWGVGSAAAMSAGEGVQAAPSVLVMLGSAAALGLVMGAVLGVAQAWVLRGTVRRPWRWVPVSAAAWAPAMVAIFAGASLTPTGWAPAAVVGVGAATGLVAGATLGLVCAACLSTRFGRLR